MIEKAATEKKTTGRKSASEYEAEPGLSLGKALVEAKKVLDRVSSIAEKALGETEGLKLRGLLEEGSLKPEVERLARKLNSLEPKEFIAIQGAIEGQIRMISDLKSN